MAEAHADDVWPLGYGINSPKNDKERWNNCDALMKKFPELRNKLDGIFCDNMNNEFNDKTGAWPEAYYFADSIGTALWCSTSKDKTGAKSFDDAIPFAIENGWSS